MSEDQSNNQKRAEPIDVDGRTYYPVDHPKGYLTVIGAFLVQFVVFGLLASFPVFMHSMEHDESLGSPSKEEVSLINSLASGPGLFLGCVGGAVLDKVGPRPLLFFCTACIGMGLLLTPSVATGYVGVIACYSAPFTLAVGLANSPVSASVGSWFDKYLEVALGIATAGGGIGSAVLPLFSGHFVSKYGWRVTWRYLAIFDVLMLTAAIICSRRRVPPNAGPSISSRLLKDDGDDNNGDNKTAATGSFKTKAKEVLQMCMTRDFILQWISGIFFGFAYSGSLYSAIPVALAHGKEGTPYASYDKITIDQASGMYTWFGVAQAIGALLFGFGGYLLKPKIVYILSACFGALGFLGLMVSHDLLGLSLSFCLIGGAYAGNWAMFPCMITERMDGPLLGTVMGLSYMGIGVGALTSSPVLAALATASNGSWYLGLGLTAAISVTCALIALFIRKPPSTSSGAPGVSNRSFGARVSPSALNDTAAEAETPTAYGAV